MTKKTNHKTLTIRLPITLWKKLKLAIIEGNIKSIQQAVIDSLDKYFK